MLVARPPEQSGGSSSLGCAYAGEDVAEVAPALAPLTRLRCLRLPDCQLFANSNAEMALLAILPALLSLTLLVLPTMVPDIAGMFDEDPVSMVDRAAKAVLGQCYVTACSRAQRILPQPLAADE